MFNHHNIIKKLKLEYPEADISLNFKNNLELLIATILSAQVTDKQVNKVTRKLFDKYNDIEDYAQADLSELKEDIKFIGLYNNKAKYIKNSSKIIINKYSSKVPSTMSKLTKLPGVGRKTANVVLSHGFNKAEGIAVDTHVKRLSQRLGLTEYKTAKKIEKDLMVFFHKKYWNIITTLFINHGRNVCKARNPNCNNCIFKEKCPSAYSFS